MAQNEDERQSATLVGNDIVFDCVHCGKSLAIGVQGAGLKIQCPECGGDIFVPIPEGLELSDIDQTLGASIPASGAETVDQMAELPASGNEGAINTLMTELEELRFRTQRLEKQGEQYRTAAARLFALADEMRDALKEMDGVLGGLAEKSSDDTQQL